MKALHGNNVSLRALEPSDLEYLYALENDSDVWEVSHTIAPYSKFVLRKYLENTHKDIYEVKQLRLVVVSSEKDRALGFVDIFNFDPKNRRAGVGIVIFSEADRGKGFASEVLEIIISYAKNILNLHQLYANISEDNLASVRLFERLKFEKFGVKKDWNFSQGTFKNELLYQLILEDTD